MEQPQNWATMEVNEVCQAMGCDPASGLTDHEVELHRNQAGFNELTEKIKVSPWGIFIAQFKDFMVLVLLGAAVLSGVLGEVADTIAILAIILINAILGFIQEYRAEKSMDALKEMAAPTARVMRNGKQQMIPARMLVPGDVVVLDSGDKVPADGRLLNVSNLRVDEAMLTGESKPSKKILDVIVTVDSSPADKKNMVFMGTIVTDGRGLMVVTATGMKTEMGKIAHMLQSVEEEQTPLQVRLDQLGRWLVYGCLGICVVVVLTGIARGEDTMTMVLVGVSLAVAAIPEGLPAIVTVSLAMGVQRMIKRHALIRRLPAVETLGCTTYICSDKTGTLTENKMTLRKIHIDNRTFDITGVGYQPVGEFQLEKQSIQEDDFERLSHLLSIGALCNNAILHEIPNGNNGSDWTLAGDPTEGSIVVAAAKAGISHDDLNRQYPRLMEFPFDSDRKRMSTVNRTPTGGGLVCVKGAAESLLDLCEGIWEQGYIKSMTNDDRNRIMKVNEQMAASALRVLGIAYKDVADPEVITDETAEAGLIFSGLVGMIDPPRVEAKAAIEKCHLAGIRTVMITGDHRLTAQAIGQELNLIQAGDRILTGVEIDQMTVDELAAIAEHVPVYARVAPHHKLNIVRALESKGHVVAMTGDGVNDAPAVKEADIGVAMGITGTDVTKEASSMILLDDNFATIVAAVEEGRAIYDNIRKFIRYLLSCNVGEVLTMFIASLLGLPLPLLPIQILWVNLATDGLPAMALGVDPADPDIMDRDPRGSDENIFSRGLSRVIVLRGLVISLITLTAFTYALRWYPGQLNIARTFAFTSLVVSQLIHVFECRSETHSIFRVGIFTNRYLIGAVGSSLMLLLAVIYIPTLQPIFRTVPLEPSQWAGIVGLCLAGSLVMKGLLSITNLILGPVGNPRRKVA